MNEVMVKFVFRLILMRKQSSQSQVQVNREMIRKVVKKAWNKKSAHHGTYWFHFHLVSLVKKVAKCCSCILEVELCKVCTKII